ncbi:MAG: VWA domain-containing protein [Candidatus Korobacteraceae bacterium]
MSSEHHPNVVRLFLRVMPVAIIVWLATAFLIAVPGRAQSSSTGQSAPQSQSNQGQQGQAPAEAGGPESESNPIAVPKKKDSEEPPPPPRPKPAGMPEFSLHVDVPVVTVNARVLQKDGRPIALSLEDAKAHFKIFEDGVPQQIQSVTVSKAPITAVLLVEFAATSYRFMYDALNASYMFASNLQPQDWVAVVEFDLKDHILVDFTQDKQAVLGALNTLRAPGFSETDIFDAMYDTLDRLDRLPGRKELVVVASGRDTFSKLTLDQILKKVKLTPNVTIYTISTGEAMREAIDARYGNNPNVSMAMMDYVQADNQMKTFARMTGGQWYKPRLEGEFPEIFRQIASSIRDQYTIVYKPTNTKQDGTYRKLRVELLGPNDQPLQIKDQKNHDVKYQIVAREGYTAKHEVE